MKNGVKSKVKAFQINLDEAVWSCERIDCIWPLGYQNLKYFQRSAMTCNWDEYVNEESTPTLSELSLYTPPMTPREEALEYLANSAMEDKSSESISSKRESTDCNKSSEMADNKFTKEKNISRNANKQMPEITNIEKVHIDIKKFFQHKHLNNEKMQKHLYETSIVNTKADSSVQFATTEGSDFNLHTQCKTEKEQNKSDNVQANKAITCLNANTNINISSTSTNLEVNVNILNNSNTTNNHTANDTLDTVNSNDLNLDEMLDIILNDRSNNSQEIDHDWLDLIKI
ncbi:GATA zinc finger domain-containing protein 8-like isoform X2 [Odontomachus brunneus]|nr:GATA zinc finger domain-containing protein 8-like isoform X2 [Odontomachus brunneus]